MLAEPVHDLTLLSMPTFGDWKGKRDNGEAGGGWQAWTHLPPPSLAKRVFKNCSADQEWHLPAFNQENNVCLLLVFFKNAPVPYCGHPASFTRYYGQMVHPIERNQLFSVPFRTACSLILGRHLCWIVSGARQSPSLFQQASLPRHVILAGV